MHGFAQVAIVCHIVLLASFHFSNTDKSPGSNEYTITIRFDLSASIIMGEKCCYRGFENSNSFVSPYFSHPWPNYSSITETALLLHQILLYQINVNLNGPRQCSLSHAFLRHLSHFSKLCPAFSNLVRHFANQDPYSTGTNLLHGVPVT